MRSKHRGGLAVVVLGAITLLGGCSPSDDTDTVRELENEIFALPIVESVEMNYLIDGFPAAAHWDPDVTLREDASLDEIEQTGTRIVELFRGHPELSELGLDIDLIYREARMNGSIGDLAPEVGGTAWRLFARISQLSYVPALSVSLDGYPDDFGMVVMIFLVDERSFAAVAPVFVMLREDFPEDPPQLSWVVAVEGEQSYQSNNGLPSPALLDAGLQPNNRSPGTGYPPLTPTPTP